jgi:hypothetical protein
MKNRISKNTGALVCIALLTPASLWADKDTLGIAPVKPGAALVESVKKDGRQNQMEQVVQALDGQLIDSISGTRKFQVVSRSDLKDVITEQEFANSGNVDTSDKSAAKQGKMSGAKYILVTTLDGFKDFAETSTVGETGQTATIRVLNLAATMKFYESTSGKLLESKSLKSRKDARQVSLKRGSENAALSDELLVDVAHDLAQQIANRVADVVFPAKVISKVDKQITINRGDGTGIAKGQVWSVFAVGKELKDPDTGEVLGKEEVEVGKIRIASVLPKVSTGVIEGEDAGIAEGAIVRPPQ